MPRASQKEAKSVFSVQDISFIVPNLSLPLFQKLSIDIRKGESLAVLGPSGVGKSTFLKMLVGLMVPHSGRICFQGANLQELSHSRRNIFLRSVGMTFQQGGMFDSLTVGENLRFPLKELTQFDAEEIESRMHKALSDVGLEGQQDLMLHEMSGGMQKRLGIARALLLSPEVVLYDDPTAGLDPVTARTILQLIHEMREKYKMTMVVVTSDPHQIYSITDRIAFLYGGAFLEVNSSAKMRESENFVVKQFLHGLLDGPLTKGFENKRL